MPVTKFYNARLKYIALLPLVVLFIAVAVLMLVNGDLWLGLLCGGFFCFCGFVIAYQVFDLRPRLELSESGLMDRALGVGIISWQDIQGISIEHVERNDYISLYMDDHIMACYLAKLSPIKRKLIKTNAFVGVSPLSLSVSGIRGSTQEIVNAIVEYSDCYADWKAK